MVVPPTFTCGDWAMAEQGPDARRTAKVANNACRRKKHEASGQIIVVQLLVALRRVSS